MAELLKDRYNTPFFDTYCQAIKAVYFEFDSKSFLKKVYSTNWDALELKERMHHIAVCLHNVLPQSFEQQLEILIPSLFEGKELELLFVPHFVATFGLDPEHEKTALRALEQITPYSTAEFAIRPFLARNPKNTLKVMMQWAQSENHHVRRLASEGCRSRLPWGQVLSTIVESPNSVLPILERLKNDSSEYVRRSVANNLNDISKDHPDLLLELTENWLGQSTSTDKLLKHACRTLLKKGNTNALRLFGFGDPKQIEVIDVWCSPQEIQIGKNIVFGATFQCTQPQGKVRIEYAIDYMKANGKHSRKVFQWSERPELLKTITLESTQSLKQMTTRKHYPGEHHIAILVNGEEKATTTFQLTAN